MKTKILSICTVALLCSSIFADEYTADQIKDFRSASAGAIEVKKKELGTTWDALAIIKIAQENIDNGINVQDNLDLIKGVMKGRGFTKGVVNVSISADERNIMLDGLSSYGRKIAENQPWQGFVTQNYGAEEGGAHGDASSLQAHLQAADDQIRKGIPSSSSASSPALKYNFAFRDLDNLKAELTDELSCNRHPFSKIPVESLPTYIADELLKHFGKKPDLHKLLIKDKTGLILSVFFEFLNLDSSDECFNSILGDLAKDFYLRTKNEYLKNAITAFKAKNAGKDEKTLDTICSMMAIFLGSLTDTTFIDETIQKVQNIKGENDEETLEFRGNYVMDRSLLSTFEPNQRKIIENHMEKIPEKLRTGFFRNYIYIFYSTAPTILKNQAFGNLDSTIDSGDLIEALSNWADLIKLCAKNKDYQNTIEQILNNTSTQQQKNRLAIILSAIINDSCYTGSEKEDIKIFLEALKHHAIGNLDSIIDSDNLYTSLPVWATLVKFYVENTEHQNTIAQILNNTSTQQQKNRLAIILNAIINNSCYTGSEKEDMIISLEALKNRAIGNLDSIIDSDNLNTSLPVWANLVKFYAKNTEHQNTIEQILNKTKTQEEKTRLAEVLDLIFTQIPKENIKKLLDELLEAEKLNINHLKIFISKHNITPNYLSSLYNITNFNDSGVYDQNFDW